jgi:hypothetical protein
VTIFNHHTGVGYRRRGKSCLIMWISAPQDNTDVKCQAMHPCSKRRPPKESFT